MLELYTESIAECFLLNDLTGHAPPSYIFNIEINLFVIIYLIYLFSDNESSRDMDIELEISHHTATVTHPVQQAKPPKVCWCNYMKCSKICLANLIQVLQSFIVKLIWNELKTNSGNMTILFIPNGDYDIINSNLKLVTEYNTYFVFLLAVTLACGCSL